MTWTISCYGAVGPLEVHSFGEIERAVQQSIGYARDKAELPTLVELTLDGHSTMAIVVGGERSVAFFAISPHGPVCRGRLRDTAPQANGGLFRYTQFGSLSEADMENTMLASEAWDALRLFFATSQRPDALEWV